MLKKNIVILNLTFCFTIIYKIMNNNLLLLVLVWKNHFLSLLSLVSSINNQTLIHNLLIKSGVHSETTA